MPRLFRYCLSTLTSYLLSLLFFCFFCIFLCFSFLPTIQPLPFTRAKGRPANVWIVSEGVPHQMVSLADDKVDQFCVKHLEVWRHNCVYYESRHPKPYRRNSFIIIRISSSSLVKSPNQAKTDTDRKVVVTCFDLSFNLRPLFYCALFWIAPLCTQAFSVKPRLS